MARVFNLGVRLMEACSTGGWYEIGVLLHKEDSFVTTRFLVFFSNKKKIEKIRSVEYVLDEGYKGAETLPEVEFECVIGGVVLKNVSKSSSFNNIELSFLNDAIVEYCRDVLSGGGLDVNDV